MSRPRKEAPRFTVERTAPLQPVRASPLSEMYTLSPFVWRAQGHYEVLLRAVNHAEIAAEKVARIYYGRSTDGLCFEMGDQPVIAPRPGDDDKDGCEDPTVAELFGPSHPKAMNRLWW